jgi:hypothetical protein
MAASCPKCGHPFDKKQTPSIYSETISDNSRKWKILTVIIGIIAGSLVTFAIYRTFFSAPPANNNQSNMAADVKPNSQEKVLQASNSQTAQPPVTQVQTPVPTGILNLEAALVYKMGGVQPVAREKFYLLDQDLEKILRESGMKNNKNVGYIATFGLAIQYPDQYAGEKEKALSAIKRHVQYSVTTDFEGKAKFNDVKAGSYYLFGITESRKAFAIWNTKIEIKAGENSIVLDQNNASVAL